MGNEIAESDASKGSPREAESIRKLMKKGNLFAMVGTIEPRKGHKELLKVFRSVFQDLGFLHLLINQCSL